MVLQWTCTYCAPSWIEKVYSEPLKFICLAQPANGAKPKSKTCAGLQQVPLAHRRDTVVLTSRLSLVLMMAGENAGDPRILPGSRLIKRSSLYVSCLDWTGVRLALSTLTKRCSHTYPTPDHPAWYWPVRLTDHSPSHQSHSYTVTFLVISYTSDILQPS
jgi:hypothetical protein